MTTRLLLLPTDPEADATWLELEPPGRITRRATLSPGERAPPHHGNGRTWTVVPAADLGLLWTALPARQQAQALAAARLLLDEAVIAEGSRVKDPAAFAKRINELLTKAVTQ